MKTLKTTTIRVGLPDPLYAALRAAARRVGDSVAGFARSGIQRHVARLDAERKRATARLPRPSALAR